MFKFSLGDKVRDKIVLPGMDRGTWEVSARYMTRGVVRYDLRRGEDKARLINEQELEIVPD